MPDVFSKAKRSEEIVAHSFDGEGYSDARPSAMEQFLQGRRQ